jgi:drug/metabolite transporter (DMT)-like permease
LIRSKENIGIIFGALAFFIFATSDVIQKYATINHTIFQIIFFRYFFLLIVSFLESKRKRNKNFYKTKNIKLQLTRSLISVIETVFFVSSFKYLSLATVHSVASLAPVFVVILSMLILRERIDKTLWAIIFFGFVGVIIILRPGFDIFDIKSLLPLGAGFFFGLYQVITKKVSENDSDETSLFFTSIFGLIIISGLAVYFWHPLTYSSFFILPIIGVMMTLAHYSLIIALARAPASKIQPFHFTLIFWAIIFGYIFYGDIPDVPTFIGALLIASSGIFVIKNQTKFN